jgi:anti-sigma regulatory factor (Ser/Thr protein kinase)
MPYHRCADCGLTTYSAATYASASTCPGCLAALTEDTKLYVTPGVNHDVSCTLLARPEAAAEARRALVGLVLPETTRESLALLVSELVNNAVLHGGLSIRDRIQVELTNGTGGVRLTVHDEGHGFPCATPEAGVPLVAGGRGLVIVDALSDTWGVDSDRDGCTVWCQVAVDQQPSPALVSSAA